MNFVLPRYVINKKSPSSAPIIAASHRPTTPWTGNVIKFKKKWELLECATNCKLLPEAFLSCCIPDLQFDCFTPNIDNSWPKLHADGVIGVLFDWNIIHPVWIYYISCCWCCTSKILYSSYLTRNQPSFISQEQFVHITAPFIKLWQKLY